MRKHTHSNDTHGGEKCPQRKVFLSHIQEYFDLHREPMILLYASPEGSKSRTGKAMTYICYRGVHVVAMREPNLFRFSQNLHATLFFDMTNLWKKAEETDSEDILLLHYEKGARVGRVPWLERGPSNDTPYYDIYGPSVIVVNEAVHNILYTQCVVTPMPNKPGRYENPTPESGLYTQGTTDRLGVRLS